MYFSMLICIAIFGIVAVLLPPTLRPWCWIALAVTGLVWSVVWLRGLPAQLRQSETRTALPALALLALSGLMAGRELVAASWLEFFDTLSPFLILAVAIWLIAATSLGLSQPESRATGRH
jgi:hypothetical protein